MRSSDGFCVRQSMYSAYMAPSKFAMFASFGFPGSFWMLPSTWARMASWSCSGIPSSMPMTLAPTGPPKSFTKSKPPLPTSGSRQRAQNARTSGSSAAIFFGVNTRESTPRCFVCWGGSSKMKKPGGNSMPDRMYSTMSDLPLISRL